MAGNKKPRKTSKMKWILIALVLSACEPQETVSVPAKFCSSEYTGNTRIEHFTTYICYAYDKNGFCTYNVPIDNETTWREANVTCKYSEWR